LIEIESLPIRVARLVEEGIASSGGSCAISVANASGRRIAAFSATIGPNELGHDVRWARVQRFDQLSEIVGILVNASLPGRTLALAMAAAVVDHDLERLAERCHHRIPIVMITPGPMHEDQRLTRPFDLIEQLHAVDALDRHDRQHDLRPEAAHRQNGAGI
jgi:hypothetical protein